jgi:CBS domain-containing protein
VIRGEVESGDPPMGTVDKILREKSDRIASLPPTATVLDAARLMNERQIGAVLVIDRERLLGIFTERDVLRRIVAAQRDPSGTKLSEVMTTAIVCAERHTTCNEVRRVMREKRIRHIPVVENGCAIGMVSIGDVNKVDHDEQEQTIKYLEQFMTVM